MNKPLLTAGAAVLLVLLLFFLGRTTEPKKKPATSSAVQPTFDIKAFIDTARKKLTPSQSLYLSRLENQVKRGDVVNQQTKSFVAIANFWKDSVNSYEPYAYYIAEASKLENSEKSLTFAARLMLNLLRSEHNEAKMAWLSSDAIALFEKALNKNPDNDSLKVGLGSVYVYGQGRTGNTDATMKGIQQLLTVVRKDSMNMQAQMVLGVGGLVSGQYEKALDRFTRVVRYEPENLEAITYLADTYAAMGNKPDAIKWYSLAKKMFNNPSFSQEVDERIKNIR